MKSCLFIFLYLSTSLLVEKEHCCLYLYQSYNKIESLLSTLIFSPQQLDCCNSLLADRFSATISNCNMYKAELPDEWPASTYWRITESVDSFPSDFAEC